MKAWQPQLDDFIAARAGHAEVDRQFGRANNLFLKLVQRGVAQRRAADLAGLNFIDKRLLKACLKEQIAMQALGDAIAGCSHAERIMVMGAVLVVSAKLEHANDAHAPSHKGAYEGNRSTK